MILPTIDLSEGKIGGNIDDKYNMFDSTKANHLDED